MPVSLAIGAAQGAALAHGGGLVLFGTTLTTFQGALLFGAIAGAKYLLRPKFDAPEHTAIADGPIPFGYGIRSCTMDTRTRPRLGDCPPCP